MMKGFIFLFPFCLLFVNGTFTCTDSDWVLERSKCYKIVPGSPKDGQAQCSKEDSNAVLMLAPSEEVATDLIGVLLSVDKIWVGLKFRNGTEWIWDDGSTGIVNWGSNMTERNRKELRGSFCPFYHIKCEIQSVPQLCISVNGNGEMYDRYCYNTDGLICQKEISGSGLCENGWTIFRTLCYKRLRHSNSGVNFRDARSICNKENAYIMMPKSQSEANIIVITLHCGIFCWVGITDFDADHTYTWEDGTEESQSNLYFRSSEPNQRDHDYICAYIQNGFFYNGECTQTQRVVCKKDGTPNVPSTIGIESTTNMLDTSMMYSGETSHQQDTSTNQKTPTTVTSTLEKQNCTSTSRSNACQCQRRMSNTTESVKITDYIWLRKCEVQPLIDSGVLNEIDCPYTCRCSPKDNPDTNSAVYDMFACFGRPSRHRNDSCPIEQNIMIFN